MEPNRTEGRLIAVWDPVVRIFHWSTVGLLCTAYYSAEFHQNEIHLAVGYLLSAMVAIRILWGFVGSHHARFANFLYAPVTALKYAQSLRDGSPIHYLGHNPLGAAMVYALLTLLSVMIASGLILAAVLEYEGPLLLLNPLVDDATVYQLLSVHRLVVYVLLIGYRTGLRR